MNTIRVHVGSNIWLVPPALVTEDFREAIRKLDRMPSAPLWPIEFTLQEAAALKMVNEHPEVWKL